MNEEKPADATNEVTKEIAKEIITNQPQKEFSSTLKVKADPADLPDDDRKKRVKALAGAIAHGMRQFGEVHLRCFGDHAIAKAAKASTIASSYLAAHGYDLYLRPYYIKTQMDSKDRTGLCFLCVSSQSGKQEQPPDSDHTY